VNASSRCSTIGRSKRDTGSFDFKKNWGLSRSPLHYEHRPDTRARHSTEQPQQSQVSSGHCQLASTAARCPSMRWPCAGTPLGVNCRLGLCKGAGVARTAVAVALTHPTAQRDVAKSCVEAPPALAGARCSAASNTMAGCGHWSWGAMGLNTARQRTEPTHTRNRYVGIVGIWIRKASVRSSAASCCA